MKLTHDRKLVLSGIDMVGASMQNDFFVMKAVGEEYGDLMLRSEYLAHAPFLWIGISLMYGLKYDEKPKYHRISKSYGDLSLDFEVDMRIFLTADAQNVGILKEFFEIATLDCLIHVGKKHKLPIIMLEQQRNRLGTIPMWNDIYDANPKIMIDAYQKSKVIN
jgi:hypothetical protein